MGSDANRLRRKWQNYSGENASSAELDFFNTFEVLFEGTEFKIRSKPKEFSKIYVDVELTKSEILQIYNPKEPITKHGVFPDFAIDNTETGKTIYVEVKRQDGWVEGKNRSAGRGNAHERLCKYFTPGLQKILREKSGLSDDVQPFWVVFQGDITRDPCRVREITCWFSGLTAHYFFWRNTENKLPLINHFLEKIKPLLH
ncbi:MAG: MunI family type II restriction endonuclease [Prevotellaceae bacterium]|jgi:hypothetical protein|nr:MunI family type II restriction endonuclease [Prevotellaceae bacterium]